MPVKSERNLRAKNKTIEGFMKYVGLEGKMKNIWSCWTSSMECILIIPFFFYNVLNQLSTDKKCQKTL